MLRRSTRALLRQRWVSLPTRQLVLSRTRFRCQHSRCDPSNAAVQISATSIHCSNAGCQLSSLNRERDGCPTVALGWDRRSIRAACIIFDAARAVSAPRETISRGQLPFFGVRRRRSISESSRGDCPSPIGSQSGCPSPQQECVGF